MGHGFGGMQKYASVQVLKKGLVTRRLKDQLPGVGKLEEIFLHGRCQKQPLDRVHASLKNPGV